VALDLFEMLKILQKKLIRLFHYCLVINFFYSLSETIPLV
jgi:hypothetical protein